MTFTSAIPSDPKISSLGDVSVLAKQIKADMETLTGLLAPSPTEAATRATVSVALWGSDTNSGSRNDPVRTLQKAFDIIGAALAAANNDEETDPLRFSVLVEAGDYSGDELATLDLLSGRGFPVFVDITGIGPGRGRSVLLGDLSLEPTASASDTFVTLSRVTVQGGTEVDALALNGAGGTGAVTYVLDSVEVIGSTGSGLSSAARVIDNSGAGATTVYTIGTVIAVDSSGSATNAVPGLVVGVGSWVSRGSSYTGRRAVAVDVAAAASFTLSDGSLSVVNGSGSAAGNITALTSAANAIVSLSLVSVTPLANGNVLTHTGAGTVALENVTKVSGTGTVSASSATVLLGKLTTAAGAAVSVTATTLTFTHIAAQLGTPGLTSGNWATSAPTNQHDANERMAALLKTLNTNTAIP